VLEEVLVGLMLGGRRRRRRRRVMIIPGVIHT
jgi:hypothetical protein